MRKAKLFVFGLAGVLIVLLIVTSLLPNKVMTSRWVLIAADKDSILRTVRDLQGWQRWNVLLQDASDIHISSGGAATGSGTLMRWKNNRGKINLLKVTGLDEKGIVTEMQIDDSRPFTSGFSVEKRLADSVQVVWFVVENLKWYPWEKFYGMMASQVKGPYMQQSLDQLKVEIQRRD